MDNGWKYVGRQFLLVGLIILLSLVFLALGLMIGYAFIGDGENAFSILSPEKWANLISKITGK